LLDYLGEISDTKCGVCDVCKDPKPVPDFSAIAKDIKLQLTRTPQTLI
jgi:hypothetical protein